jgi:hypothetical protein
MEFINQVKKLKDQTKSPEVRQICEEYLSGNSGISKEYVQSMMNENLVSDSVHDLDPVSNYREAIKKQENSISRRIADSLMESWDGLGRSNSNNSGTYIPVNEKKDNSDILEKISSFSGVDSASGSFIEAQSLKSLGILESILRIKESSIYEHHPVKILCERYIFLIENRGISEFNLIDGFIKEASDFKWDSIISDVLENLNWISDKYSREIEVSKVLESIKSSGSYNFYSDLSESLNDWLVSEDKSSGLLIKSISKFSFNPVVKNLINYLKVNESKNSKNLEIPNSSQSESSVDRVYSPVIIENGKTIFALGKSLFEASPYGVTKISNSERSKIDKDYLNLVSLINSNNVKVNENGVSVGFGKKIVRIVEENSNIYVYLDKSKLNFKTLSDLGKILSMESGSYLGVNENENINKIIGIYNGVDKIVELDFVKSIISNIYEGVSANLIKWEGKIYINRVNEGMLENSLFHVNGTQAVNMIREFLRYDISEGLTEFLEGEQKLKSIMVNDRNKILENITKVEKEISKVEEMISTNPDYSDSKEIKMAHSFLNKELSILKEKWNQINLELNRVENEPIEKTEMFEDSKFNIGTYVKVKESGESGKIISVDNTSGRYTILMDSGKTSDFTVSEIVDLESALNQAANDKEDSERSEEEGGEEVKESMRINSLNKSNLSVGEQKKILKGLSDKHSFSNAPSGDQEEIDMGMDGFHGYNLTMNEAVRKIQKKYKSGNLLAKAPGNDKMSKGKSIGKKLLSDAPGKKGNVDFDGEDASDDSYEIGYNIKEQKVNTNYSKAPEGGSKVPETKGIGKTNYTKAPEGGSKAPETKGTTSTDSLVDIPNSGKKGKDTKNISSRDLKNQDLKSAPGKEGNVSFKASKEIGYNVYESDDIKKK